MLTRGEAAKQADVYLEAILSVLENCKVERKNYTNFYHKFNAEGYLENVIIIPPIGKHTRDCYGGAGEMINRFHNPEGIFKIPKTAKDSFVVMRGKPIEKVYSTDKGQVADPNLKPGTLVITGGVVGTILKRFDAYKKKQVVDAGKDANEQSMAEELSGARTNEASAKSLADVVPQEANNDETSHNFDKPGSDSDSIENDDDVKALHNKLVSLTAKRKELDEKEQRLTKKERKIEELTQQIKKEETIVKEKEVAVKAKDEKIKSQLSQAQLASSLGLFGTPTPKPPAAQLASSSLGPFGTPTPKPSAPQPTASSLGPFGTPTHKPSAAQLAASSLGLSGTPTPKPSASAASLTQLLNTPAKGPSGK